MQFVTAQSNVKEIFFNDHPTDKLTFQLYPNPFSGGKLHIISNSKEIKNIIILNILGEVVFKTSTFGNYVMPNNLKTGIYIVKIKQGPQQGLTRLVVP